MVDDAVNDMVTVVRHGRRDGRGPQEDDRRHHGRSPRPLDHLVHKIPPHRRDSESPRLPSAKPVQHHGDKARQVLTDQAWTKSLGAGAVNPHPRAGG